MWKHEILQAAMVLGKQFESTRYYHSYVSAESAIKNSIVFYIGNFREFVHCFFKCKINEKYNDLGITEKPIVDFNTCPYNPMLIEFYEVSTVGLHKQALLIIGGKIFHYSCWPKEKVWQDVYITPNGDEYINPLPMHMHTINIVLKLLTCKNVELEQINPHEKLNKIRLKRGKLPHYSYSVLTVNPFGNKKHYTANRLDDHHNRIHFQRGHFKHFSDDKPLFGKLSGIYWWQPHLRGQNKDGFVDKEYHIKTE